MAKWPSFVTKDLDPDDDAELMRRWEAYDRDMKVIIARGGVHQDDDGWWVETATGELIGPDPEIERPRTDRELKEAKPFAEIFPDLAESIKRSRGRPPKKHPKEAVTLRLDPPRRGALQGGRRRLARPYGEGVGEGSLLRFGWLDMAEPTPLVPLANLHQRERLSSPVFSRCGNLARSEPVFEGLA